LSFSSNERRNLARVIFAESAGSLTRRQWCDRREMPAHDISWGFCSLVFWEWAGISQGAFRRNAPY
jgi:hypothetical protein